MGNTTKAIGLAATTAWILLAVLTAGSGLLDRNTIGINLVVASLFFAVALLVLWKTVVVESTRREMPKSDAIRSLLRVEAVIGIAVLLLGVVLLVLAGFRAFVERAPVFG